MTRWTDDEMHTAMCLWEAWLEIDTEDRDDPVSIEAKRLITAHGTCTMRQAMTDLVKDCDQAWETAHALGYDDTFDWEFVPTFLHQAIQDGRLERNISAWWAAA